MHFAFLWFYVIDLVVLMRFMIAWEERTLHKNFEVEYAHYAASVPAWWPRLGRRAAQRSRDEFCMMPATAPEE